MEKKKHFTKQSQAAYPPLQAFGFFLDRSFLQIWLNFCSNDLGKTLGPYGHHHDWLVGCLAWLPYSRERGEESACGNSSKGCQILCPIVCVSFGFILSLSNSVSAFSFCTTF